MSGVPNPWAVDQCWSLACQEPGHTAGDEQSFTCCSPLLSLSPEPPPTVETSHHPYCVKLVFHKSGLWWRKVGDHCSMCFQNNLMIFFVCFPTKHTSFRRSFLGILIARNAGAEPLLSQFQYL